MDSKGSVAVKHLADAITGRETWLMERILRYARETGYTKYTSTLVEAWRMSIAGLSESFLAEIERAPAPRELGPDESFADDSASKFGVLEARLHRQRGVTLAMFLGLMKYYRQSYIDLVCDLGFDSERERNYRHFIERFFDRVEIAFCSEWSGHSEDAKFDELRLKNRL
jgi:diguanylate cyclase